MGDVRFRLWFGDGVASADQLSRVEEIEVTQEMDAFWEAHIRMSMCLDQNGMEWAHAWMTHKDPPKDKMGFGYMLMGGSDASNTDPFATTPKPAEQWVDTGPHIMVLNIGDRFAGYPTSADNTKRPYVMFPNTPYAHLMMPVK